MLSVCCANICALETLSQHERIILGIVNELHRGRGNSDHSKNPCDAKHRLPPGWNIVLVSTIFTLKSLEEAQGWRRNNCPTIMIGIPTPSCK